MLIPLSVARDVECAGVLRNLRYLFERELGQQRPDPFRATALYRGLLHVVLSHQGAWLLADVPCPRPVLDLELGLLERILRQRHRQYVSQVVRRVSSLVTRPSCVVTRPSCVVTRPS